jgi:hypothetical protein
VPVDESATPHVTTGAVSEHPVMTTTNKTAEESIADLITSNRDLLKILKNIRRRRKRHKDETPEAKEAIAAIQDSIKDASKHVCVKWLQRCCSKRYSHHDDESGLQIHPSSSSSCSHQQNCLYSGSHLFVLQGKFCWASHDVAGIS